MPLWWREGKAYSLSGIYVADYLPMKAAIFVIALSCFASAQDRAPDSLLGMTLEQVRSAYPKQCDKLRENRDFPVPTFTPKGKGLISYCPLKHPQKIQFGSEVKTETLYFQQGRVEQIELTLKRGSPVSSLLDLYGAYDDIHRKPNIDYSPVAGTMDVEHEDGSSVYLTEDSATESDSLWWTNARNHPALGIHYYSSASRSYIDNRIRTEGELTFFQQYQEPISPESLTAVEGWCGNNSGDDFCAKLCASGNLKQQYCTRYITSKTGTSP